MSDNVTESMKSLFSNMENFVSTKTVVGEAVHIGDVILVPLVDVSFGMATGQSSSAKNGHDSKDGGGGAVGAKMTPTAVIVIMDGTAQLISVKNQDSFNKLIDMVPGVVSKLSSFMGKKDDKDDSFELEEDVID